MQLMGGTNLPQSWDALQDSRQLFIDPTKSRLWLWEKVAKNFTCDHTEWVAFSKQACVYPHLSGGAQGLPARSSHVTASYLQSFAFS